MTSEVRFPAYITDALSALKPPDNITVSEWADKYRVLGAKTNAEPGRWRTDRTPYIRAILDAWGDDDVERITFVKPTQVGGTETILNAIGYAIDQDPNPILIVYPTVDLAESTSDNRIKPMIELCKPIAGKFNDQSKKMELQFSDTYIALSGANSTSSLAGRPVRYVLLDEIDKYPRQTGKEASPMKLAIERTKTFEYNKKIFATSTPTLETGNVWTLWESADTQYEYFVPCGHCGVFQTLRFPQIRWDDVKDNANRARETAVYVCPHCGGAMNDRMIRDAVRAGEWRVIKSNGSRLHSAYRLNAIVSPWLTLGDIAYEFKVSKKDPEDLMNFVNSWLAEPWKEIEGAADAQMLARKTSGYPRGTVPTGAALLTGGVDVQKNGFYFVVRSWSADGSNALVERGFVTSWDDVTEVMNRPFTTAEGGTMLVNLCLIDSGDQTDKVYDYCAIHREWAAPSKGSSGTIHSRYRMSSIDREGSRANGMQLVIIDTNLYKDAIYGRILASGGFQIYDNCEEDYIVQVTAEQKVTERRNGRKVSVWRPKTSHADNHYLDCEVYCAAAADIAGFRALTRDAARGESVQEESRQNTERPADEWTSSGDWGTSNTENW